MKIRNAFAIALAIAAAIGATGCGHLMMMMNGKSVARPAATEFGTGPRASATRQFTATLQPDQPLRPRHLQTLRVAITDAAGRPVDDATIQVDGGMPHHGHGLPTRPRVTRALGNGLYESKECASTWAAGGSSRSRSAHLPAPTSSPSTSRCRRPQCRRTRLLSHSRCCWY